jgi:NAD(P)H-hydrate epimerase
MSEALDETDGGTIAHKAVARALELAASRAIVAIGPGLSSLDAGTRSFVSDFVAARNTPVIIDADGLNALAPWPAELEGSDELPIVITPHPGEMARLVGKTNAEVLIDRISVAQEFAVSHHVITVLKGQRTLIVAPSGRVYVNPTGNAGMATAGAGDVLTGIIAGLIAQQPSTPLEGVIAAVYLHGLAGDIAAGKLGMRSVVASSITDCLPEAILRVGGEAERK